jgi:integrase
MWVDTGGRYGICYGFSMASIHKTSTSPYYYAAFYGPDGRRKFRSTKTSDRKSASKICLAWQEAAAKARRHELTATQCRRVLGELLAFSSGETLEHYSVEGWIRSWLAGKKASTAAKTFAKYEQISADFLAFLGSRKGTPLGSISPADVAGFRDHLRAGGRSVVTCNIARSVISIPFSAARRQGIITHNPCEAVDNLRERGDGARFGREAFTPQELSRLVAAASSQWRGLIVLGATSGLRLRDAAGLRWEAVDLERGLLALETAKTGEVVVLPIHSDFDRWLSVQQRGIGKAHVFPALAGLDTHGGRGLSVQFRRIMEAARITERIIAADGKAGRSRSNKGFHSLRHGFISGLANAGVAAEIRQKLAGHSDSSVHERYTHHELETLRNAVAKLPSLSHG